MTIFMTLQLANHSTPVVRTVRTVSQFYKHRSRKILLFFSEKEFEKLPNLANWLTLGTKSVSQVSQWIILGTLICNRFNEKVFSTEFLLFFFSSL